eukprot:919473-Alexandrium_andersonii.AAC.1
MHGVLARLDVRIVLHVQVLEGGLHGVLARLDVHIVLHVQVEVQVLLVLQLLDVLQDRLVVLEGVLGAAEE